MGVASACHIWEQALLTYSEFFPEHTAPGSAGSSFRPLERMQSVNSLGTYFKWRMKAKSTTMQKRLNEQRQTRGGGKHDHLEILQDIREDLKYKLQNQSDLVPILTENAKSEHFH